MTNHSDDASRRAKHATYMRQWRKENPESYQATYKRYFDRNTDKCRQSQQSYRQRIRAQVLEHYGGQCTCCGERTSEFLAIDHINNDGKSDRASIGNIFGGFQFARFVIKQGFPDGLQVLCHNCHGAKHFYGKCPHQKED